MKKVFAIILLQLFILTSFSQNWCPPGATWYYGYTHDSVLSGSYFKLQYTGDTVINSINAQKIEGVHVYYEAALGGIGISGFDEQYTYADSDRVYLWRDGSFIVLYDFSLSVGDTLSVAGLVNVGCDTVGAVKVDSVGTMVINSEVLRYISVSPTSSSMWGWNGRIVEKIGPIYNYNHPVYPYSFMLPTPDTIPWCGTYGFPSAGNFRCYSDDIFGFYSNTTVPCDYTVSIKQNNISKEIVVYPNPAFEMISIRIKSINTTSQETIFSVYDVLGNLVHQMSILNKENSVDISSLPSGIYFYTLKSNNHFVDGKFVKGY